MMYKNWREAVEVTKIRRINWKNILGMSMNKYVKIQNEFGLRKETIIHNILIECKLERNKQHLIGWCWLNIIKNVKVGVSSRYSEIVIYS